MKAWLLKLLMKETIKEFDLLKPYVANQVKSAQDKLGSIPPEAFANQLVIDIQVWMCKKVNLNPADIGIKEI